MPQQKITIIFNSVQYIPITPYKSHYKTTNSQNLSGPPTKPTFQQHNVKFIASRMYPATSQLSQKMARIIRGLRVVLGPFSALPCHRRDNLNQPFGRDLKTYNISWLWLRWGSLMMYYSDSSCDPRDSAGCSYVLLLYAHCR